MARKRRGRAISGWIVLDKPVGVTSTTAVSTVRDALRAAKAGHAGTLDPLASGLLPVAIGEATKVVSMVMESEKSYRFTVQWGQERDTDDAEGTPTAESASRPDRAAIEAALSHYLGEIEQVPPVYSAIKVAGERAYDMAREGRPPVLAARQVWIGSLTLLDCPDADHAEFVMTCGKGAYVRSLARDLGRALGCFAHVTALRRTRVGPFHEENAISLDIVRQLRHKDELDELLSPVETALADIPALAITGSEADRLKCGQAIRVPQKLEGTVYATTDGRPVALVTVQNGEVRPVRVFNL